MELLGRETKGLGGQSDVKARNGDGRFGRLKKSAAVGVTGARVTIKVT